MIPRSGRSSGLQEARGHAFSLHFSFLPPNRHFRSNAVHACSILGFVLARMARLMSCAPVGQDFLFNKVWFFPNVEVGLRWEDFD
jgi:hypothetical protein